MYLLLLFLINEDGIYWHLSVTLRHKSPSRFSPFHFALKSELSEGIQHFYVHF